MFGLVKRSTYKRGLEQKDLHIQVQDKFLKQHINMYMECCIAFKKADPAAFKAHCESLKDAHILWGVRHSVQTTQD